MRQELSQARKRVRDAIGCNAAVWGCGPLFILGIFAIVTAIEDPAEAPKVFAWTTALVGLCLLIGAWRGWKGELELLDIEREIIDEAEQGERRPREHEVIEARIVGAVLIWTYADEGLASLLLDLGDRRLVLFGLPQDYNWSEFFQGRPLHREFRLVCGCRGLGDFPQVLSYEPLVDELAEYHEEDLAELMDQNGLARLGHKEMIEMDVSWPNYAPHAEFDGTLATWPDDVLRAKRCVGPRSISRAEPDPDADRGLSRPE